MEHRDYMESYARKMRMSPSVNAYKEGILSFGKKVNHTKQKIEYHYGALGWKNKGSDSYQYHEKKLKSSEENLDILLKGTSLITSLEWCLPKYICQETSEHLGATDGFGEGDMYYETRNVVVGNNWRTQTSSIEDAIDTRKQILGELIKTHRKHPKGRGKLLSYMPRIKEFFKKY